ncbi:ABC transporter permease [Tepidibacter mesophilus]|uniref:ABC transporter permease n=1 Tax=Tepidibacter mesophilus TaxID=655607 RepID=UPI001651A285|nr:ABC transporter permease [Tepidibacter mesophilus]
MKLINEIIKFFKQPKNVVILILGPLFLTFLFGGVYIKDYLNDIPIVVLDMDNSSSSRMIVNEFKNNDRYYVSSTVNSFEELKYKIDSKEAHMGIYIPKDFNKDIKKQKSSSVALIIDESNITVGNTALSSASEILATINAGINIKILQAKGIDPKTSYDLAKIFNIESRVLYDAKYTYKGYVMPGIILVFVQQLFLSAFIPAIMDDKENIFMKSIIYSIVASLTYVLCALILKYFLDINFTGSLLYAFGYVMVFILALVGPGMLIAALFKDKLQVTQFTMLLSMPTFLTAGYAWPVEQTPVVLSYIIKGIWPLVYAITPIRDILVKSTPIRIFSKDIMYLIVFGCIWAFIGYNLFKRVFKNDNRGGMSEQEGTV